MSTTWIILKREYITRVTSKGWIIATIVGAVGIIGLSFISVGMNMLKDAFVTKLVIVAPDRATGTAMQKALAADYSVTLAPQTASSKTLPPDVQSQVKKRTYDAGLVAYRSGTGLAFTFYPRQVGTLGDSDAIRRRLLPLAVANAATGADRKAVAKALDFKFDTVALNERYRNEGEEVQATALVYFLLLLLYISVILYGVYVAQGVIEEKSNRVMEVMIGAVRPRQLLAGKVLGVGAVALTQMTIFALAGAAMLVVSALYFAGKASSGQLAAAMQHASTQGGLSIVPPATLIFMLVFFLLGFFSYAALFAGMGALASKAEDLQNGLLMWPIVLAYLLSVFALNDPEKPVFVVASMLPLISPMLMFTRVAISSVPAWQVAVAIALSLLAIWGFTLLAAKLYRVGVLMYGKPPKLADIWRAVRAPS